MLVSLKRKLINLQPFGYDFQTERISLISITKIRFEREFSFTKIRIKFEIQLLWRSNSLSSSELKTPSRTWKSGKNLPFEIFKLSFQPEMPLKVVFCPVLDQGHFVISIAIAKSLLYRDPNSEIYFVTDQEYAGFVKGNLLARPIANGLPN